MDWGRGWGWGIASRRVRNAPHSAIPLVWNALLLMRILRKPAEVCPPIDEPHLDLEEHPCSAPLGGGGGVGERHTPIQRGREE